MEGDRGEDDESLLLAPTLAIFGAMITKRHILELRELGKKKPRAERGRFLVEGLRLAEEAADSDFEIIEVLFTQGMADSLPGKKVLEKLRRKTDGFHAITDRELQAISDTVTAQGIVVIASTRTPDLRGMTRSAGRSVLVGLDAVSDPGNLGSLIRTCDWFGIDGILLGKGSVELYNPKVVRSTMGGLFHLPIMEDVDLFSAASALRSSGFRIYVSDGAGEEWVEEVQFAERSLIIFGNEAHGVSPELKQLSDARVAIRRFGSAESLNVGVACGVVLSMLRRSAASGERKPVHQQGK
jgi:RNA methyltransferase, TrmH family